MIAAIFLVVAIILFIFGAADDGIHADAHDLIALGLAAFAAAHIPIPDGWRR